MQKSSLPMDRSMFSLAPAISNVFFSSCYFLSKYHNTFYTESGGHKTGHLNLILNPEKRNIAMQKLFLKLVGVFAGWIEGILRPLTGIVYGGWRGGGGVT